MSYRPEEQQGSSVGVSSSKYDYTKGDEYSSYHDPDKQSRLEQEKRDQDLASEYAGPMGETKSGVPAQRGADSNKAPLPGNARRDDSLWKGFTFEYIFKNDMEELTLFINPENYNQTEPARVTVTQTKGGMFVDHFGPGVKTIQISGTTGYFGGKNKKLTQTSRSVAATGDLASRTTGKESGQEHFLRLRKMYRNWLDNSTDPVEPAEMRFHNWADKESYQVAITTFNLQRAVGRPLLYQYNIQMTVIRALDAKKTTTEPDITDLLGDSSRNLAYATNLSTNVGFFDNLISNLGLTGATKTFGNLYAKGLTFYNTVNGVYETMESVVNDVRGVANDINMVIAGAATFVSKPFNIVSSLADSISDICDALSSWTLIPNEAIRAFRNMQCTLQVLPESLFQGFTNPELFEGASNCGTTLGIPDASVSEFPNSFTATAQLPSERATQQVFQVPTDTLLLKETPIQVIGVYINSDVERTGLNYLDSYNGTSVKLTSVPNVAVVVDYTVQQPTTQGMIQLATAAAYIVQTGDTPTRIALNFYGDASRWKEIILYNGLSYPYITEDPNYPREVYATGTARFYRQTAVGGDITIPAGTRIYVPSNMGTFAIYFETIAAAVLPLAQAYVDVFVEAVLPGKIGNVAPNVITGCQVVENDSVYYYCILAHTAAAANEPGVGADWATYWAVDAVRTGAQWVSGTLYEAAITGIASVNNLSPTLGGMVQKIAIAGDVIFIPQAAGQRVSTVSSSGSTYDELFGIDIQLNTSGEIDSGVAQAADLSRTDGVSNLAQALRNRLKTSKAYYPYNPAYGSNLPLYIGRRGTYNWYSRLEKEIIDTMLDDNRLKDVKGFKMIINGDLVVIDFNAETIAEQTNLPVNVVV